LSVSRHLSVRGRVKNSISEAGHIGSASDAAMRRDTHKAATATNRKTPARMAGMPAQFLLEAGGLLRLPQVLALVGVGKSTWWKLVRDGRAPQAVKLSDRCTAWRAADVATFIENAGQSEPRA
jgi:predicted DNA-binding transcriptional regulator AlpA